MPEMTDDEENENDGRKKFTPETLKLADAISDSDLDNEQRLLLARDIIQSVLQDVEEDDDPVKCVAEGIVKSAAVLLGEALGFFCW